VGQIPQRSASLSTHFTFALKLDNRGVVHNTSAFARNHNHSLKPHLAHTPREEGLAFVSKQGSFLNYHCLTVSATHTSPPNLSDQDFVHTATSPRILLFLRLFTITAASLQTTLHSSQSGESESRTPNFKRAASSQSSLPLSLSPLYFTLRSHFYVYGIATPHLASSFSLLPSRSSLPSSSTTLAFHIRTS
jgi:hypothetical protein